MNKDKQKYKLATFILPEHWLPALFNDDFTGLEDGEEERIREWIKDHNYDAVGVNESTRGFYPRNDADGWIGCDCVEVTFRLD